MIRVAFLKLTSCSGCLNQSLVALLSNEELLGKFEFAYFTELGLLTEDYFDILFVEGSVSNSKQEKELREFRKKSKTLVALGTCAVQGGIQSLRSGEDVEEVKKTVYPFPDKIDIYSDPKPISDVVKVDFAITGCPINGDAVVNFLRKYDVGGLPLILPESVCCECKRNGLTCVMVAQGTPCLGPVTVSGCGALCPSFQRGCYGCYGLRTWDLDKTRLEKFFDKLLKLGAPESMIQVIARGYGYRSYKYVRRG
ncbi:MAG: hypothetical protein QXS24_02670 [Desulfurococcaceae archaeon]